MAIPDHVKHRIVGAAVLLAVLIIFFPFLFHPPEKQVDKAQKTPALKQEETPPAKPIAFHTESIKEIDLDHPKAEPLLHEEAPVQAMMHGKVDPLAPEAINQLPIKTEKKQEKRLATEKKAEKTVKKLALKKPSQSNGAYLIQIAYLSDGTRAQKSVSDLKKKGYPALLTPENKAGKTMYRIAIGPFSDRKMALFMQAKLAQKEQINGFLKSRQKG